MKVTKQEKFCMKIEMNDLLSIKQHLEEAVACIDSLLASKPDTELTENERIEAEISKVHSKVPGWFPQKKHR
jgi:hypothetical protein